MHEMPGWQIRERDRGKFVQPMRCRQIAGDDGREQLRVVRAGGISTQDGAGGVRTMPRWEISHGGDDHGHQYQGCLRDLPSRAIPRDSGDDGVRFVRGGLVPKRGYPCQLEQERGMLALPARSVSAKRRANELRILRRGAEGGW